MKPKVIAIVGPTASGKTAMSIELAKKINELVSNKDKYSDWLNRADIKADLQCDIIMLLTDYGFPALPEGTLEDYEKVYSDVIEQSENFRKYYNA